MIAHKYHVEFVTIVLESFQVCYYLFSHRSSILVDSSQSCFLWNCYKWHFGSRYFEILAKALSCRAALRHQAPMWSLNVKRLSMMTPRALTDFSGLSMVLSSNFNSMSSVGFGDNTINWNFVGFHYYQTTQRRFCSHWVNLTKRLARSMTNVTLSCHQHNYRGYTFQWIEIGY